MYFMGCLHNPADVQQTSSKFIQNTRANAGRLLDRVNTLLQCFFGDVTNREFFFTKFTEATRTTGGLSKHRQKPYNAYYPNN